MLFLRNYFLVFLTTYLIVTITKLIFVAFYFEQYEVYTPDILLFAIAWGYRFDFALAGIVSLFVTLFDFSAKLIRYTFILSLAAVILLQLSDILYFEDASRHIGYELKDILVDTSGLFMTALSQNTLFTLFSMALLPFIFWLLFHFARRTLQPIPLNRTYLPKKVLLIALSIFFVRGMFAHIPLNPWQSSQIGDNRLAAVSLNGSYNALFSVFTASGDIKMPALPPVTDIEISNTMASLYDDNNATYTLTPQRQNVILFFLESWSGTLLKPYGAPVRSTPFFDAILLQSLHPIAAIANGHRTTEGMFASLVSFQNPLEKTVAKTRLQDFEYHSLIDILNANGYSSAFFQGTAKETSGTGSLAQKLGFKKSYGKEDVTTRRYETNYWGIHDQDLYAFALNKLKYLKEPFVLGINGATTHDDKIPSSVNKIAFVNDEKQNNRLNALHFSDAALREFVSDVKAKFPNTLFVFFADHCGGGQAGNFNNFLIPLAFYGNGIQPHTVDHFASQRDIAPTVLDLVLGDYKKLAPDFSGKSLARDTHFFADYFRNGVFGWIENKRLIEYTPAADATACFDVSSPLPIPVTCTALEKRYKEHALSFGNISQKLLFQGKTGNFHQYRFH